MPQWVEAPPVTPDVVARGVTTMSAGGGKEIHFDSSALRQQYDAGGTPVTDPAYVPEIVTNAPSPKALAETIPADVLKAMANGGTPSPESLRAMMVQNPPQLMSGNARVTFPSVPLSTAVELTIPVGNGTTARVMFNQQPTQNQWKKLIRHLEIEAEDADEKVSPQPDLAALADAALRHAASIRPERPESSEPRLLGPVKRRKRKDVSGAGESGELVQNPESGT